jgi:structural maintenance of chromosomes protein 6
LRAADTNVKRIQKDIEAEHERISGANGDGLAQKLDEIENSKMKAQEADDDLAKHEGNFAQLQRDLTDAQEASGHAKPIVNAKRDAVRKCEATIHNLTVDSGNWLRAYDPKLPTLLRAIDNERGFKTRPVGPLGRHVRLLKPEWSSILERTFGGTLNAFAVTSKDDQMLLSSLMRRTQW